MDASQLSTGVFHVEHVGNMAECSTWNVCDDSTRVFHVEHSGEDSCQVFHVEHCLVFAQVVGCYPMRCDQM